MNLWKWLAPPILILLFMLFAAALSPSAERIVNDYQAGLAGLLGFYGIVVTLRYNRAQSEAKDQAEQRKFAEREERERRTTALGLALVIEPEVSNRYVTARERRERFETALNENQSNDPSTLHEKFFAHAAHRLSKPALMEHVVDQLAILGVETIQAVFRYYSVWSEAIDHLEQMERADPRGRRPAYYSLDELMKNYRDMEKSAFDALTKIHDRIVDLSTKLEIEKPRLHTYDPKKPLFIGEGE